MEKGSGASIWLVGFNITTASNELALLVTDDTRIGVVLTADIRNPFWFPSNTTHVLCCESAIRENATALVIKGAGEIEGCVYVKVEAQNDFETKLHRVLGLAEPEPLAVKPVQPPGVGNGVRLTLKAFVYQNGNPDAESPPEINRLVMLAISNGFTGATYSGVSTYYYQFCKNRGVVKQSLRGKKRANSGSVECFEAPQVNAFLRLLTQLSETLPGFLDALRREREENQAAIVRLQGENIVLARKLEQLAAFLAPFNPKD